MVILKQLVFVLSMVAPIAAFIGIGLFEKDETVINIVCPFASLDFGLFKKVTGCAAMCNTVATCKSFFYNKHDQFCKGAPVFLSSTDGCETVPGTAYYQTNDLTTTTSTTSTTSTPTTTTTSTTTTPTTTTTSTTTTPATTTTSTTTTPMTTTTSTTTTPTTTTTSITTTPTTTTTSTTTSHTTTTTVLPSQYGNPCSSNDDCPMTAGTCLQSMCSCQAGYRYDSSSGNCVINCINYGSTYIEYQNVKIDTTDNVGEYNLISLSDCMKQCSNQNNCFGFNYRQLILRCKLKSQTPLTNPNDPSRSGEEIFGIVFRDLISSMFASPLVRYGL